MRYLSLDTIDLTDHPYPATLDTISITMRGTKNLFDIYFSASDVEESFGINLPAQFDFTWINTPSGKEKYLSYPTIKRLLYPVKQQYPVAEAYLTWVDGLLFANHKVNLFFRNSHSSVNSTIETMPSDDEFSDLDDVESIDSFGSVKGNELVMTALQHKVNQLEHRLELQTKDIHILERDVQLRDKEIELLKIKLRIPMQSQWI